MQTAVFYITARQADGSVKTYQTLARDFEKTEQMARDNGGEVIGCRVRRVEVGEV